IVSTADLAARLRQWVDAPAAPERGGEDGGGGAERHARPGLTTPYEAPRSESEQLLVEIWQELLGLAPVGIHDNFFDLGGHSLLGIQLNARLRRAFGIDLALRTLFASPTVAQLAAALESALIGEIEGLSDEEARSRLAPEPPRAGEHAGGH